MKISLGSIIVENVQKVSSIRYHPLLYELTFAEAFLHLFFLVLLLNFAYESF